MPQFGLIDTYPVNTVFHISDSYLFTVPLIEEGCDNVVKKDVLDQDEHKRFLVDGNTFSVENFAFGMYLDFEYQLTFSIMDRVYYDVFGKSGLLHDMARELTKEKKDTAVYRDDVQKSRIKSLATKHVAKIAARFVEEDKAIVERGLQIKELERGFLLPVRPADKADLAMLQDEIFDRRNQFAAIADQLERSEAAKTNADEITIAALRSSVVPLLRPDQMEVLENIVISTKHGWLIDYSVVYRNLQRVFAARKSEVSGKMNALLRMYGLKPEDCGWRVN